MDLGLYQQQSLKLVMTTELKQAITLLQYSTIELHEFLEEQALENPLIELKEFSISDMHDRPVRKKQDDQPRQPFETVSKHEKSLQEVLQEQVSFLKLEPELTNALHYLINSLDENGYLEEDLEKIADTLGYPLETIKKALTLLQQLEPYGIGARDLKECLLIQMEKLPTEHPIAEMLVAEHLEDFAEKRWKLLSKKLDIGLKEIQEAFDLIQSLNPRPGACYTTEKPRYIIPDLYVRKTNDGYEIVMNDQYVPQIQVNDDYRQMITDNSQTDASKYVQSKYQQILWLKKSIEQRRLTLLKVMTTIVNKQVEFFQNGPGHLRPLTLKEVAEEADIHESTVSRSVKNKYVQTPHGLFEMKHFFNVGVRTDDGEEASSSSVKEQIKALIDTENPKKPFSDQKLADALKKEKGIVVSRRTVAKYREQMNIPSSSKRKRYE